jgi:hypothetical protein
MPENKHVIVGASRVVCVVTLPSELPDSADDAQFIVNLPLHGRHADGIVTMLEPNEIPRLRKLGATVTVIDPDGNSYVARIQAAGDADGLVASIDADVSKSNADFAIAQAGDDDPNERKA